jgi:LysR family transcriptional activator of nhaA
MDLLLTNFLPTATDSKALFHRIIAKKNVSVFSSSKFKGLMKHFPHSLSGQPFIVPTYDSKLRYDLAHWSQSKKIELNIIAESQDIAVNKLMAINGMGLIPAPAYAVQRQVLKGELIELGQLQGVYEELFLVTANRKIENAIAAKLMKNFEI